jgi:hypothetical protein
VVFSTNRNDCHDITEILLKVTLNTINPNKDMKLPITFPLPEFITFKKSWNYYFFK